MTERKFEMCTVAVPGKLDAWLIGHGTTTPGLYVPQRAHTTRTAAGLAATIADLVDRVASGKPL